MHFHLGERFLAEFILSFAEGLGITTTHDSVISNGVRDLSLTNHYQLRVTNKYAA